MTWAPDYVLPAELKDYLRIGDTADDVFIALWVTAASRNVDNFCGRQFGQVTSAETRTYTQRWDRTLCGYVAQIDDVQDITSLTVTDSNSHAITDYTLLPENNPKKGKPYEYLLTNSSASVPFPYWYSTLNLKPRKITVSAKWGWTAVPSSVPLGLLLQGARLAARRDSPFGVAGSPTEGSEIRLLAQLDPDFRTVLKPLQRTWWAA